MDKHNESNEASINLRKFNLESHVEKAFFTARTLAGDRAVNARDALQAAVIIGRTSGSEAFRQIATLLTSMDFQQSQTMDSPTADLSAFPVTRPFAEAYSVAEEFFADGKSMWGRDYVTLALLATGEDSLIAIANEAGITLESLRNHWFQFVITSSLQRRDSKKWEKWWQ